MKFFLDTEFIERGPYHPVTLISIGIVSEEGDKLYAVSSEFDSNDASQWVKDNVLSHIPAEEPRFRLDEIARQVKSFVRQLSPNAKPEFWGYYADYDWVVFAQIFGTMMDLPKEWPMYCRDLKQWCDDLGNPQLPEQSSTEHNALNDAQWSKIVYEFLEKYENNR